jgi:hypothetical protein
MSAASETLLDLFQASDTMETADEDDEIEEEDLVNDPRLMTHIDDFVEEAPLPKPKKRKGSSQTSSTPATQAKKNRTNAAEPRRFSFSVTITLTGEDVDPEFFAPLLEEFVKTNTEKAIVCFERGEVEKRLHCQCMMVTITTTPAKFKLSIEKALFDKGARPTNLSICLRQLSGKGMHCVQGLVGYCRKAKDEPEFLEILHNISKEDKDTGDLLYILHGRSDKSKTKVELSAGNLINKMEVFLKYKTDNIVRHTRDPLCLLLKMLRTGHYALKPSWVYEKGGLDLSRFHSLWRSTVQPDLLEVKDIVNIMFPRAFFGGDENAESDEDTNFTYAACSSALRNDSHSHDKRHRSRYFDPALRTLNRTVAGSRFQDTLNEFRGKRAHHVLSTCLSNFDKDMDEHEEMKDYFDPLFSDDVYKCFRIQENVRHEDSMEILDNVLSNVERDLTDEFVVQDDFVSLLPSKILANLIRDNDSDCEND